MPDVTKCDNHDALTALVQANMAWQRGCEAKLDAMLETGQENSRTQKDIMKCLNDLALDLAKNYVTKEEFRDFTDSSEQRIVKVHERLDKAAVQRKEDEQNQREYFVKVIAAVFAGGALAFAVVSWLVELILNGGG